MVCTILLEIFSLEFYFKKFGGTLLVILANQLFPKRKCLIVCVMKWFTNILDIFSNLHYIFSLKCKKDELLEPQYSNRVKIKIVNK